jgi:hypothetical protein
MWKQLLERLGRRRVIMDRVNDEPYLERYYVFLKDRTWFPFNIFVHRFLKSDPTDVHDHPWSYFTLILRGGYWEWIPIFDRQGKRISEVAKWRGAGHWRFSPAASYHRIELDPEVECWSLFMPGPHRKEWGFLVRGEWMQWQQYLESKSVK